MCSAFWSRDVKRFRTGKSVPRVWRHRVPTLRVGVRKSIDGLAALVQAGFELDPVSDAVWVFCNRDRDKLKLLRWDHHPRAAWVPGFWLYDRRLERGRFQWPKTAPTSRDDTQVIDRRQLTWLLDGLSLEQRRRTRP